MAWGQIPALLLKRWVTLGKLFDLSEPQFPHLKTGVMMIVTTQTLWDCCED